MSRWALYHARLSRLVCRRRCFAVRAVEFGARRVPGIFALCRRCGHPAGLLIHTVSLAGGSLWPFTDAVSVQLGQSLAPVKNGKQIVAMKIDGYDYVPNRFNVRQGVPVEWRIDAKDAAGCGRILLSRGLGIQKFLSDVDINVIAFTPQHPGEYSFNCGMGMMTPGSGFTVH